jgi:hypothetical protein
VAGFCPLRKGVANFAIKPVQLTTTIMQLHIKGMMQVFAVVGMLSESRTNIAHNALKSTFIIKRLRYQKRNVTDLAKEF